MQENTPGPAMPDFSRGTIRYRALGDPDAVRGGSLTLRTIRDAVADVVERRQRQDPNLHHLNGLELFGEADEAILPLPDRLHPDAAAHALVAERFHALALRENVLPLP